MPADFWRKGLIIRSLSLEANGIELTDSEIKKENAKHAK
jgi:hypothetical protein